MSPSDQSQSASTDGELSATFRLKERLHTILGVITGLIAILYLIHIFLPSTWLLRVYSTLALVLLVFGAFTVRRGNQIAVILLLIGGFIIFFYHKVEPWFVLEGFGKNINLLTLFFVVPLIGIVISTGGYLTALKHKLLEMQKVKQVHPYRWSAMLTSFMGLLLNLGSLPLIYRIAEESFPSFQKKKMGFVLLRSFVFCMFWSPYFVNVSLVLVLFHLSWVQVGWISLSLASSYLLLTALFFKRIRFENDPIIEQAAEQKKPRAADTKAKMKSLVFWVSALVILSFVFDFLTDIGMLTIVSLMALLYSFVWAFGIGILQDFIHSTVEYVKGSFDRLKNEVVVFISAGFFGLAISYTSVGEFISGLIHQFSFGSVYLLAVLIIVFVMILAVIGIHPVIVVIGIGSSLEPSIFGVSPVFLAANLLMAWALATSISPFSGSVLMASSLSKESPWVIVRHNLAFNLVCLFTLPILLYALHLLGIA